MPPFHVTTSFEPVCTWRVVALERRQYVAACAHCMRGLAGLTDEWCILLVQAEFQVDLLRAPHSVSPVSAGGAHDDVGDIHESGLGLPRAEGDRRSGGPRRQRGNRALKAVRF